MSDLVENQDCWFSHTKAQMVYKMLSPLQASQWANSRMLPGAFIGSTGANVMSQEELIGPDKRRQAWLKKVGLTVHSLCSVVAFI